MAIEFDFRPNVALSRPFVHPTIKSPSLSGPIFAGLTPGYVGLYQINLKLPDTFPAFSPCPTVTSNLTIDIGYLASSDFVDTMMALRFASDHTRNRETFRDLLRRCILPS